LLGGSLFGFGFALGFYISQSEIASESECESAAEVVGEKSSLSLQLSARFIVVNLSNFVTPFYIFTGL